MNLDWSVIGLAKMRKHLHSGDPVPCWCGCGKMIMKGDEAVSVQSNQWRRYHLECYRRTHP